MEELDGDLAEFITRLDLRNRQSELTRYLSDLGVYTLSHLQDLNPDKDIGPDAPLKPLEKRRFLRELAVLRRHGWTLPPGDQSNLPDVVPSCSATAQDVTSSNPAEVSTPERNEVCDVTASRETEHRRHCTTKDENSSDNDDDLIPKVPLTPDEIRKRKRNYQRRYRRKLRSDPSRAHVLQRAKDRDRERLRKIRLNKRQATATSEPSHDEVISDVGNIDMQKDSSQLDENNQDTTVHDSNTTRPVRPQWTDTSLADVRPRSIKEKIKQAYSQEQSASTPPSVSDQPNPDAVQDQWTDVVDLAKVDFNTLGFKNLEEYLANFTMGPVIPEGAVDESVPGGVPSTSRAHQVDLVYPALTQDTSFFSLPVTDLEGVSFEYSPGVKLRWAVTCERPKDNSIHGMDITPEGRFLCATENGIHMLSQEGAAVEIPFPTHVGNPDSVAVNQNNGDWAFADSIDNLKTMILRTSSNSKWVTISLDRVPTCAAWIHDDNIIVLTETERSKKAYLTCFIVKRDPSETTYSKKWSVSVPYSYRFQYICIDQNNIIYMKHDDSILLFDAGGNFLRYFHQHSSQNEMAGSEGFSLDSTGRVYTVHRINGSHEVHVKLWSPDGKLLGDVLRMKSDGYCYVNQLRLHRDGMLSLRTSEQIFTFQLENIHDPERQLLSNTNNQS